MNAPEDQNGLREALARDIREWDNRTPGRRGCTLVEYLLRPAGPLASLIAERDAAVADQRAMLIQVGEHARARGEAEGALWISEKAGIVEGWRARALAAEAEITRLKEGMEGLRPLSDVAAPGEWSVSGVRRRVDEASCVIIDAPSCSVLLALPTGNGVQALEALRDAKLAVAAVNFVRAALATLSPKEHPHG